MESAEQAALSHRMDSEGTSFKYVNSKNLGKKQNANLELNRHFDQRYVNVTRSSVIIPKFLNENGTLIIFLFFAVMINRCNQGKENYYILSVT